MNTLAYWDLVPDLVKSLKLTQELGLLVVNVEPGAPAHRAGMLLGDVIITLDGKPVLAHVPAGADTANAGIR